MNQHKLGNHTLVRVVSALKFESQILNRRIPCPSVVVHVCHFIGFLRPTTGSHGWADISGIEMVSSVDAGSAAESGGDEVSSEAREQSRWKWHARAEGKGDNTVMIIFESS
jgi:hypothetical protein